MCGVYGFIANGESRPNLERLKRMAEATERRGPHAFGMAWIDGRGRLKAYRQTGRITDSMGILNMAKDARALIGHCRYTTRGSHDRNINNHPHPADGGWLVHNGRVSNYDELAPMLGDLPTSECDSEALAMILADSNRGTLLDRNIDAAMSVSPDDDLATLGLWKPGRLVMVKRGKPMSIGKADEGVYFGSLPRGLPAGAKVVRDWTARQWTWRADDEPKLRVTDLERPEERTVQGECEKPARRAARPTRTPRSGPTGASPRSGRGRQSVYVGQHETSDDLKRWLEEQGVNIETN